MYILQITTSNMYKSLHYHDTGNLNDFENSYKLIFKR